MKLVKFDFTDLRPQFLEKVRELAGEIKYAFGGCGPTKNRIFWAYRANKAELLVRLKILTVTHY